MRIGRRCLLASLLAAPVLLWLLHPLLLRGLAALLVVDQACPDADYVVVVRDGYRRHQEAARIYQEDPSRRVVLVKAYPEPIVRLGIVPSLEAIGRRELAEGGVPTQAVVEAPGRAWDEWAEGRLLGQWLADRPHARLLVLCSRFQSRHYRHVLDTMLGKEAAARVAVRGLRDRDYDETNWWTRREGVRMLMVSFLRLGDGWCRGGQDEAYEEWNLDDYQRELCRGAGETR